MAHRRDADALKKQIENLEERLRLIDERMAEYVLPTDVPLYLIKQKRELEQEIAQLEAKLAQAEPAVASPTDPSAVRTEPLLPEPASQPVNALQQGGAPLAASKRSVVLSCWCFVPGFVLAGIVVVLFNQLFHCFLEYRVSEAIVALLVLLLGAAAAALAQILPLDARRMLRAFIGGVASAFLVGVLVFLVLPPPAIDNCPSGFRVTGTPTAAETAIVVFATPMSQPTFIPTSTYTPTATLTNTPTATPTHTPTATPTDTPTLTDTPTFTPTPTCPPACAGGTVPPAISISSIIFVVNGVEQIFDNLSSPPMSAGDTLRVKAVTVCAESFVGNGGKVYVEFDPVDETTKKEIKEEVKSTREVKVAPGLTIIPGPGYTWTIGGNWQHISVVTVHYPMQKTEDPTCDTVIPYSCEKDDRVIVPIW